MSARDLCLILDFGSQYTQLIARRVRELEVYSEIHPYSIGIDAIRRLAPRAIVLSGGPSSVYEEGAPKISRELFELGIPILGICYGLQLTVKLLGGRVEASALREYGRAHVTIGETGSPLLRGFAEGESIAVWMSHGDRAAELPAGFVDLGSTGSAPHTIIADEARRIYGLQFHPEVAHTPRGGELLSNFLHGVAGCARTWSMASFAESAIADIRKKVDKGRVVLGLSGGVDSSVTAALLARAIGDRLTCIFVDNGLLRSNERATVEQMFKGAFPLALRVVDARDRFLAALAGITDPEQKRKIIGKVFIDVFDEEAHAIGAVDFLAQGTLYPDVIESVSPSGKGPSAVIKSHHNVGGLPERMKLKLVEPLRELFKDEVRELGVTLGMPADVLWRQPFPGPGLAVRCLGEVTAERLVTLRAADAIVDEEIRAAGLYRSIWQSFGVLLPVRSVGVMGDARTYAETLCLRAVHSTDGMTADWVHLPYDLLATISRRVVNEVAGVNRVVYDITSKPPGTIEWE